MAVATSSWYNDLSFVLKNLTCESLCEYFSKAYEHFQYKVEFALMSRRSVKVEINFEGSFLENREVGYEDFRQVEHFINYYTIPEWVHSRTEIRECYNSCMVEVNHEIANNLPAGVQADSYEMSVYIGDFDEDLD